WLCNQLQCANNGKNASQHQSWHNQRNLNQPCCLPARTTVQACGLIQIGGDRLQGGEEQQNLITSARPDRNIADQPRCQIAILEVRCTQMQSAEALRNRT